MTAEKVPGTAIVLTLPYPISANRYWATRVVAPKGKRPMAITYVTPEAKAYREQVQKAAILACVGQPIAGRVQLELQLYPHRPLDWERRVRKLGASWDDTVQCIDLGNAEKVLSDALQGIAYADDCQHRRIILDRMEPDGEARVVVTVTALAVKRGPQVELLEAAS